MRARHWLIGIGIAAGHSSIGAQAPTPPTPGEQQPVARPGEVAKTEA
jgi:hypothetical protein